MESQSIKTLIKSFESRLQEMTEEDIISLSKNDNSIFNVVRGLHKESFGTKVWDYSKPNFDYFILYTTRVNDKLEGFILRLQPHLKTRNELTTFFASFICKRYNLKDHYGVFNTFQDGQRSLFERLDYWTYDDTLREELKGRNGTIFLKGQKGILYVPFATESSKDQTTSSKNKKSSKAENNEMHFVYLMHNKRNNYYKIGRSVKPEYREKTLQAEEPDIILIDKWIASAEVERILHRKFKDKKKRGEWFVLTEVDINNLRIFMTDYVKANGKRKL